MQSHIILTELKRHFCGDILICITQQSMHDLCHSDPVNIAVY